MRYDVTVELRDARGREQEALEYVLDLTPIFGLTFTQEWASITQRRRFKTSTSAPSSGRS